MTDKNELPLYEATQRVYVEGDLFDEGQEFRTERPAGRTWKPLNAAAKAAKKSLAAAPAVSEQASEPGPDPQVAALQKAVSEADDLAKLRDEEIADLKAQVAALEAERDEAIAALAKFDGDGDGKPGGSKPRETLSLKPA